MKLIRKGCYLAFFLLLFVCWAGISQAIPVPKADILYIEKDLQNGWWQYDFTFFNATEISKDPAWFLYQVDLHLIEKIGFNVLSTPDHWKVIFPTTDLLSVNLVSTATMDPGLAPDSSLSGFSFQFNQQVGNLPFVALFWNNSDESRDVHGTTAPVPEPATIFLVATGVIGLGLFRRKKMNNQL